MVSGLDTGCHFGEAHLQPREIRFEVLQLRVTTGIHAALSLAGKYHNNISIRDFGGLAPVSNHLASLKCRT